MMRRGRKRKEPVSPAPEAQPQPARRGRVVQDAPTSVEANADRAKYVTRLAAALAEVSAAQERWLREVEKASETPGTMATEACQARLSEAMVHVGAAAERLRVHPVPFGFEPADQMLARAQLRADAAAKEIEEHAGPMNASRVVLAIRHLDEMSQLLQQAYQLLRA